MQICILLPNIRVCSITCTSSDRSILVFHVVTTRSEKDIMVNVGKTRRSERRLPVFQNTATRTVKPNVRTGTVRIIKTVRVLLYHSVAIFQNCDDELLHSNNVLSGVRHQHKLSLSYTIPHSYTHHTKTFQNCAQQH